MVLLELILVFGFMFAGGASIAACLSTNRVTYPRRQVYILDVDNANRRLYTNGNIYVMNNEAYSDITKPPAYSETRDKND